MTLSPQLCLIFEVTSKQIQVQIGIILSLERPKQRHECSERSE